ncbi:extracellular solute-binding protein [Rhabdaerophilum calidifontis]|uniref:extracellular solute-binding protein n=1 Tax=Rhabdaerophilum calidifontis TaxID=2604328 RepID=UPI00140A469A|nr:extracellular solute-binding protein [Rhabdaerophilum calidifontis]
MTTRIIAPCRSAVRRAGIWLAVLGLVASLAAPAQAVESEPPAHRHALAMHGEPALPADFAHLPYVNPDAPKGGALRYGIAGSFDSLNTMIYRGNSPPAMVPYIVQPLMMRSMDEPFTLYGLVAETIAVPEDRSFVEFRIDPRARFSDGVAVTARDVLFSWTLFSTKGRHIETARKIERVELRDAMTIRFTFKSAGDRELPLILGLLPVLAAHATDPETFANPGFTAFTGSGPYLLEELVPGTRVVLRRRADYWAKDKPIHRGLYNFDTIALEFFRDSNAMFEALKTGLLDYRVEIDPTKWREGYDVPAVRDGRIIRDTIPIGAPKGMSGFIFNTRRTVFADPRLREALLHLFDFEWLNRSLFDGIYRRTGSFFDESELSFRGHPVDAREAAILGEALEGLPETVRNGQWRPPVTDGSGRDRAVMRRAIALLDAAGYAIRDGRMVRRDTGAPLAFEIMVTNREKERIALAFADVLKQVGIFPAIRFVDSSQYWARLRQFEFDMIIEGYVVGPSPGQEQANRWSSRAAERPGSLNWAGVRSAAVDRAIAALLAATDKPEYLAAVRALDRLLIAGHYVLPLYHLPERWVARWRHIARPDRLARYDIPIDSFWFAPNR